jgi:hypothetical protein
MLFLPACPQFYLILTQKIQNFVTWGLTKSVQPDRIEEVKQLLEENVDVEFPGSKRFFFN